MNDEPLHTWIEPELEARITALVLGEASDFEREELERLISERPELGAYRKRLETIHELLRSNAEGETEPEGEWKLSDERRATVLATLGQPRETETDKAATDSAADSDKNSDAEPDSPEGDESNAGEKVVRPSFLKRLSPTTLAACAALMLTAIVAITIPASVSMLNVASFKADETDAYVSFSGTSAPESERVWHAAAEVEVPQVATTRGAVHYDVDSTQDMDPQNWNIPNTVASATPVSGITEDAIRYERDFVAPDELNSRGIALNRAPQSPSTAPKLNESLDIAGNTRTQDRVSRQDNPESATHYSFVAPGQAGQRSAGAQWSESADGTVIVDSRGQSSNDLALNRVVTGSGTVANGVVANGGTISAESSREFENREKVRALSRLSLSDVEATDEAKSRSENVASADFIDGGGTVRIGGGMDSADLEGKPGEETEAMKRLGDVVPKGVAGGSWSSTRPVLNKKSAPSGETTDDLNLNSITLAKKPSSVSRPASKDDSGVVMDIEDKVPLIGDLPQVGRLFKSEQVAKTSDEQRVAGRGSEVSEAEPESDMLYAGVSVTVGGELEEDEDSNSRFHLAAGASDVEMNKSAADGANGRFHAAASASDADMNRPAPSAVKIPAPAAPTAPVPAQVSVSTASVNATGGIDSKVASAKPAPIASPSAPRNDSIAMGPQPFSNDVPTHNVAEDTSKLSALTDQVAASREMASEVEELTAELESLSSELQEQTDKYHDHAYDHTRARMLREVAEEWETPVPKSAEESGEFYKSRINESGMVREGEAAQSLSSFQRLGRDSSEGIDNTLRVDGEMDNGEINSRVVAIAGVVVDPQFEEMADRLNEDSSIDGINPRYLFDSQKGGEAAPESDKRLSAVFGRPLEGVASTNPESDVMHGGVSLSVDFGDDEEMLGEAIVGQKTDAPAPVIVNTDSALYFDADVDAEEMPAVAINEDVMQVGRGGIQNQTNEFGIALNTQPEAVEFDGFINYGEEIKQAQNLRGFNFRELRAEVPTALEEIDASDENFSTFSLHVGDVSFKLALAALAKGEWPDASRIRIEEFVNALTYDDLKPTQEEKVACQLEQATHPFLQQRNLLRVSMSTAALGRAAGTPLHLTFLLDNSGSMERIDRQETVRRAFAQLAGQLQPNDQVTLISFARQPRLLADQVSGDQAHQLVDTVSTLPSEGGTNLEAALNLAFEKATEQQAEGAQNRVILLTDGAANLGDAEPESLSAMIETMRDKGIAFDAAGIGADGLNDEILEALTRKGDGRYYLLDRPEDADDGFARQIAGALRPAAGNVKVQIEFNPDRVGKYKLLGFEKHRLEKEDFRDDSVDAAEMAAEESGVAVYQFEAKPDGEGDIGFASVRFRDMSSGEMVEKRWPILYEANAPRPDQAAPSMRIATAASQFAAHLKGDPAGAVVELGYLSSLLSDLPERYAENERVQQLKTMVEQARQISGQ